MKCHEDATDGNGWGGMNGVRFGDEGGCKMQLVWLLPLTSGIEASS